MCCPQRSFYIGIGTTKGEVGEAFLKCIDNCMGKEYAAWRWRIKEILVVVGQFKGPFRRRILYVAIVILVYVIKP